MKKINKIKKLKKNKQKLRKFIYFFSLIGLVITILFLKLPSNTNLNCANSKSCISDLTGLYNAKLLTGEFQNKVVIAPQKSTDSPQLTVLGIEDAERKRIEVDLTNQILYAFENDKQVFSFPISSGKWGKTPTGEFRIWIKLRYTRMQGGSKELGTYYNLPNVPHTMFFYNEQIPKWRGFGIHGAYWHNNFGHPMSHGCINMALTDVEQIYNWATPNSSSNTTYANSENPGTKIIIYGKAPNY